MTVRGGAKTVQGPDSTALWEMGFTRRMAPQAPKARNLTLAAVLGLQCGEFLLHAHGFGRGAVGLTGGRFLPFHWALRIGLRLCGGRSTLGVSLVALAVAALFTALWCLPTLALGFLQPLQFAFGVFGGLGIDVAVRFAFKVNAFGAFTYRFKIPRQVDVTRQGPAQHFFRPGFVGGKVLVNPDLERAGMPLEKGVGVALVPLLEQGFRGGCLFDGQLPLG